MDTAPFGRTGHHSTRVIFGAAALGAMRQEKADQLLALLLEHGVNHIDTAASYGDSELRVGPWMERHRDRFFLATKTGERTAAGAAASLRRSLERLRVERVDLIQLHNLVDEAEWETALGPGGALEALVEARARGLVRFIGVTGHGTRVAAMHRRSLERFPFDSVLLPYNFTMMRMPDYAADFEALLALCQARGVAVQTIKAVARRRWQDDSERRFSWYEPLRDPAALRRAVRFVLGRPGLFVNSSSDATILRHILAAAAESGTPPPPAALEADVARFAMEPLFVRGVSDAI
jgi:aryl-alcohol dehydrogenase-like predicted oxidoreductase